MFLLAYLHRRDIYILLNIFLRLNIGKTIQRISKVPSDSRYNHNNGCLQFLACSATKDLHERHMPKRKREKYV